MTRFHFRLQKVLEWREKQLELEEARFQRQMAEVAEIDGARAALQAAEFDAEMEIRRGGSVLGQELAALSGYRRFAHLRMSQLAADRAQAVSRLSEQERTMMEARRRCRLLERLKQRRLAEWESARDKELDEMAAESYLARWVREATEATGKIRRNTGPNDVPSVAGGLKKHFA